MPVLNGGLDATAGLFLTADRATAASVAMVPRAVPEAPVQWRTPPDRRG